jgi:hypothetical protein
MCCQCRTDAAMSDPSRGPAWNGWSPDLANTRFQPANVARLTAAQVPKLKLKWAFGFPSGVSANAQPTIAAGRVFVGSDNGFVYSMDAKTGCVYWSFETGSIIRNAVVVGAVKGAGNAKYAAFVGDGHANVYGINAQDGSCCGRRKSIRISSRGSAASATTTASSSCPSHLRRVHGSSRLFLLRHEVGRRPRREHWQADVEDWTVRTSEALQDDGEQRRVMRPPAARCGTRRRSIR